MVRGNWQRRVEITEARKTAAKLQKEHRRNKRNSSSGGDGDCKASYRRLEEWLDEKGDGIGVLCDDDDGAALEEVRSDNCITVDIWTDARPENRPEYLPNSLDDGANCDDGDDEDGRTSKGKPKGKQNEKNRGGFKKNKGKSHPNAKNKSLQENESVSRERSGSTSHHNLKDDRLCGQEFFFGKDTCMGNQQLKQQQRQKGGRRGRSDSFGGDDVGCSLQHYHQLPKVKRKQKGTSQSAPMTLGQVLNGKFLPHHIQHSGGDQSKPTVSLPTRVRDATLKSSFDAAIDDADSASCIDMIYHSRFFVDNKAESSDNSHSDVRDLEKNDHDEQDGDDSSNDEHDNGNTTQKSEVHVTLQQILDREKLPPTSVVYLSIQGVLIYDRHREGLVISSKEERFLLFGDAIDVSADENLDEADEDQKEPMHIHEQLTSHLLDEILSYAGDEATAVLPRVCVSWRDEVGTRSPQLWKMLLNRHGWPLTVDGDECESASDILDECQQCKSTFVSHYTVVRDVRALAYACNYMTGGSGGKANDKHGLESALQVFKATKGAPALDGNGKSQCIVKIWSDANASASTRALVAYQDFTLRLFEVDRGNSTSSSQGSSNSSAKTRIKCRQIVCVRAAPPSISQKKDRCELMSMDLDDDVVACFVVELTGTRNDIEVELTIPWMTVFFRENVVCAGNEGMLDDECIQSFDLRGAVLDFLLGGSPDTFDELRETLHSYLAMYDGDASAVRITVTPKLVACGKGYFLFHAFILIPGYSELPTDREDYANGGIGDARGHRLFLFSTRDGTIVKSLQLERYREGTSLFASRPFERRGSANTTSALCTSILVSGPTMALLSVSVEIRRDGTIDMLRTSLIENEELAPWSRMNALVTSSHAIFSTDPVQGLVLHFQGILSSGDEVNDSVPSALHSIELGGQDCKLLNIFIIREHYVAVIIGNRPDNELEDDEDELFDGHWFGHDGHKEASSEMLIYHIPSRREMFHIPIPLESLSLDCIGDTLAMNVSNLGFVITGGNARDVARTTLNEDSAQISSPSGKTPKKKKKRLASASGGKKDGFARGMSLRG
mmetsp:Transcript_764/g.1612  ORF Transcript_764/g.1612 Transcript_764/m.1612 type:complete len:1067 (-) Transcript_764:95-3295(-)